MRVSVITPCLNAADTIERAFDSVLMQGDSLCEHIVIDGGSTDGTLERLERHQQRLGKRLRWVSEPDKGIYDAMNKGVAQATGDWILVLGADDVLEPNALDAVVRAAEGDPTADLVFGDAYVKEPDGRTRLQSSEGRPRFGSGMPLEMPVCHQACAYSARVFEELRGFDSRYRVAGDYDFYMRFHEAGLGSVRVSLPLATYSLAGVSSRMMLATAREYRDVRIVHGMPLFVANARFVRSLTAASVMRLFRRIGTTQVQ